MKQWIVLIVVISLCSPVQGFAEPASRQERYTEATYSYSHDPTKAVLTIATRGQNLTTRSVVVFGDGRIEISHNRRGEWEGRLSQDELDRLIALAVRHGLAEWDGDTIRAWQLADFGRPFLGETDGMVARILLNIAQYQRGEYQAQNLQRAATVRSPAFVADTFPNIPQFTAIEELVTWMADQIEKAQR